MPEREIVEGRDYYVDSDGLYVFTEAFLKARGYCCRSGCRHCPYGFVRGQDDDVGDDDAPAGTGGWRGE